MIASHVLASGLPEDSGFTLAFLVGAFADSMPKGRVMFVTNLIKVGGCLLIFFNDFMQVSGVQPYWMVILAYAVVGFGAAAWWAANPAMLPLVLLATLLILFRTRKIPMGAVFLVVAAGILVVRLAAGGTDNGAPGERPYHPGYYAAFLLDPDGNNIEAVFHGEARRSAPSVEINFEG